MTSTRRSSFFFFLGRPLAHAAKMAREGKDEMVLYVLHNVEPYALTEKPEEEPSLDINDLLCFLRS